MIRFYDFASKQKQHQEFLAKLPPPPGEYTAAIVKSERVSPTDGTNEYLSIVYSVTTGQHQGREIQQRYYWHDDKGVGFGRLVAVFEACGVPIDEVVDESKLVGKGVTIKVTERTNPKNGNVYKEVAYVNPGPDPEIPF